MPGPRRALLIHDQEEPLGELTHILENLKFEVVRTRSCSEALQALKEEEAPSLVFTDVNLPDGTWKERRARHGSVAVARGSDTGLPSDR